MISLIHSFKKHILSPTSKKSELAITQDTECIIGGKTDIVIALNEPRDSRKRQTIHRKTNKCTIITSIFQTKHRVHLVF